jgi:hypothetical protein
LHSLRDLRENEVHPFLVSFVVLGALGEGFSEEVAQPRPLRKDESRRKAGSLAANRTNGEKRSSKYTCHV